MCGVCGKEYVGETKGSLDIRMTGHNDDWMHEKFKRSPFGEHFCLPGHDFTNHDTVYYLDNNSETMPERVARPTEYTSQNN